MSAQQQIIGLTGGIGSGKSAATDWFERQSISVVDADLEARTVVKPGSDALAAIARHFGSSVLTHEGLLDRTALRRLVFNSDGERHWLEALLHPLIRQQIEQKLAQASSPYTILSSPLLLETDQYQLVDEIVVIDVPEALQLQRASQRDCNSSAQIRKIMAAQLRRDERMQRADHVVDNSGSLEALYQQLEALHNRFLHALRNLQ